MDKKFQQITNHIIEKSKETRAKYLDEMRFAENNHILKKAIHCTNLAHACAALTGNEKDLYIQNSSKNIGIITAYNDMLSAHQPFEKFPEIIRNQCHQLGLTAQVASGVPAMCDGVTQGYAGMELSLFSRDIIAQSTAIGLSHACFDGVVYLGVCDKIIPGLLIAALRFGYLPSVFCPAGPMQTGISNKEKANIRNLYAEGKATKNDLLSSEMKAYHSAGTCTFYGTANSNQLLMEIAGLHLSHTTFIPANSPERETATRHTISCLSDMIKNQKKLCDIVDERTIVNMIVALCATGGSTNLTIHLIVIAKAAGICIDWHDMNAISDITPLLCKLYPNGAADVNAFHQAGGVRYLIYELSSKGILHNTPTINGELLYSTGSVDNSNQDILRTAKNPFSPTGGIIALDGTIGKAVVKVSAIPKERWLITAPAKIFYSQEDFISAFQQNLLNTDFVAVFPFQGPSACGMPELHKLIPPLTVLQNRGFKVALITDGRMSGASGSVPAAIHVSPEATKGGHIAHISDGDMITIDCHNKKLLVESRFQNTDIPIKNHFGLGRELFDIYRKNVSYASEGATIFEFY